MSTHNIGFYEDLTKIIFELSSNMHLISSAVIARLSSNTHLSVQLLQMMIVLYVVINYIAYFAVFITERGSLGAKPWCPCF